MSNIKLGISNIDKLMLGTNEINALYLGNNKIYTKQTTGETWILNEVITWSTAMACEINFISNNTSYDVIYLDGNMPPSGFKASYLKYLINSTQTADIVYQAIKQTWNNQAYRTVTFLSTPTGDLLTWLQENGIKQ